MLSSSGRNLGLPPILPNVEGLSEGKFSPSLYLLYLPPDDPKLPKKPLKSGAIAGTQTKIMPSEDSRTEQSSAGAQYHVKSDVFMMAIAFVT